MEQTKKVRRFHAGFLFLIWTIGMLCLPGQKALAASAAVNLSLNTEDVEVGNTFWIVLTVEASEEIGDFKCYLSFDNSALRFISGGTYVTGGDGLILISDNDSDDSTSRKYAMKFKAVSAGEMTIQVDETVNVTCALDDTSMSVSSNQLLFEITNPERVSDDTALAKLLVSSGELSPAFSSKTKKYTMEVGSNINQIAVNAIPRDEKATVSINGNTKLTDGKNTVKITVTAPSGDQATTKIVVTKKAVVVPSEEMNEDTQTMGDAPKGSVASAGVTAYEDEAGNRFLSQQLRLQVLPLDDESLLPANYEKTTIVVDGLPIIVYTFSYDLGSDELLVYGMNQDGETGLYQYNRATRTLARYDAASGSMSIPQSTPSQTPGQPVSAAASYIIAIGILATLCIILTILLVFQKLKDSHTEDKEREDDFF